MNRLIGISDPAASLLFRLLEYPGKKSQLFHHHLAVLPFLNNQGSGHPLSVEFRFLADHFQNQEKPVVLLFQLPLFLRPSPTKILFTNMNNPI